MKESRSPQVSSKPRQPWRRFFLIAGFVVCLIAIVGVWFLIQFKPSPTEVNLTGSSTDLGAAYGRALRWRTKLITWIYLDRIVCQNKAEVQQASRAKALATLPHWPKVYVDELRAMAAASGAELGTLAYGNTFLDLGPVRAGCRSVVTLTPNGVLHAHNLDWDNLGGLGRWTTCIVRRHPTDGRLQTVAISFPGMIGALDIINEKGLALSFNQLGFGKGPVTEPVFVMIRRLAEHCTSFAHARQQLLAAPPGMPFLITVSEATTGLASVFERTRDGVIERRTVDGWIAACNAAQGTNYGTTRLDQIIIGAPVSNAASIEGLLAHPEVMMGCNIYSVVFDWRQNRLRLASGEVPAAVGGYREYPLRLR